jgi:hypothetical protein
LPTVSGTIVTTNGATALTTSGNLTFTGTGNRIIGDFSNATVANRLAFQNSVTNTGTNINALPNGTALGSFWNAFGNSDPTNASFAQFGTAAGTDVRVASSITGTGTYLPLLFLTGGFERVRVDTSGNVGIGTSSPTINLHVAGAAGGIRYACSAGASNLLYSDTSAGYLGTENNFPLIFQTNNAARMRIDSSGNVGIGRTPDQRLQIAHPTAVEYDMFVGSTRTLTLYADATQTIVAAPTAVPMIFRTSDTERMRITPNGNLCINTTSTINNAAFINIKVNPTTNWCIATQPLVTDSYNAAVFFNLAASDVGTIVPGASSTAYNTTSDYRLKENIAPMTGALGVVQQLKPCTYTWKATGESTQGFIAHELQEVVPECVTGEKDAVDANGKPKYQGVDTSFLVATLTAAIQEQQAIITDLKTRIELLEGTK